MKNDKIVYVDNNATTPIAPEVYQAMIPYLTKEYFNPSSAYRQAEGPAQAISNTRRIVTQILGGVSEQEVIFTSCATESNNWALWGAIRANPNRRHIVTSAVEHPAIYEVCKEAQREGLEVTFVPVDRNGDINKDAFIRALRPDTLLVSMMHANNETGVIFPIKELARITKETDPSIIFHTDATQTVGKLNIDLLEDLKDIDMLSFSGHKLHAPKGVGALYMKKGTRCRVYMIGGHQERGLRAGTENVPHIVALGKALELAMRDHQKELAHLTTLKERLEKGLLEKIPYVEINGRGALRLPNTTNLSCHYIEGEGILYQLNEYNICASSGSACTSGSLDPSHVLKAMDIPFSALHGSIRISLSRYNNEEDVDHILEVFPKVVSNLRRISPYWDQKKGRPRDPS